MRLLIDLALHVLIGGTYDICIVTSLGDLTKEQGMVLLFDLSIMYKLCYILITLLILCYHCVSNVWPIVKIIRTFICI